MNTKIDRLVDSMLEDNSSSRKTVREGKGGSPFTEKEIAYLNEVIVCKGRRIYTIFADIDGDINGNVRGRIKGDVGSIDGSVKEEITGDVGSDVYGRVKGDVRKGVQGRNGRSVSRTVMPSVKTPRRP